MDNWSREFEDVCGVYSQISKRISEKAPRDSVQAAYFQLTQRIEYLDRDLDSFRANPSLYRLTDKDIVDRKQKLERLKNESRQIQDYLNGGRDYLFPSSFEGSGSASSFARGQQNALLIMENNDKSLADQDKKLDVLAGVVGNIKEVSLSLGHELKVQDKIIDDLDDHMGKTTTKVSKSTKMASFLTKNASVCGLQLTVLALLVIIVLVALI
eukprot:TRINITY_DN14663_c0_g1_i1.p1 TRINITY_DN14663_c0_g1~~TRINITY_DN14663_c0_g1_i1.p1  ORF type:complete len:212 (+),score=90.73 TRINITY_DN14663_c0_g1_i1:31-666(+)